MRRVGGLKVIQQEPAKPGNNSWYENDVWKLDDLGLKTTATERQLSISFTGIRQEWLKELIKKYLKLCAITGSASKIVQSISALKLFAKFLFEKYPGAISKDIDRSIIEDYLHFLNQMNIKITTKNNRIVNLSNFLKTCHVRKWIDGIEPYLIYQEDHPKIPKNISRYMPESVVQQLHQNIKFLDDNLRRMFSVLLECGMRVSELVSLKYDCLLQDSDNDYHLKIFQFKLKKEYKIPVSKEVADIILEQQEAVKAEWGTHEFLFPVPHKLKLVDGKMHTSKSSGKLWRRKPLSYHLNVLAKKQNILGPAGELWHFDTHSFRHTTATRMINSGVSQHIVQKFLGHESPEMTSRYAHIHDETLKQEFAKFQGKLVNIAGENLKPEQLVNDIAIGTDINAIDARWLKKNILMQALPNGTCALPVVSNKCPHANACLTCTNFRTDKRHLDSHKKQLEYTVKIIDIAKSNGWKRQEEMNIPVKDNLEKIISALEPTS
jgi:integrase/recombinase XerD